MSSEGKRDWLFLAISIFYFVLLLGNFSVHYTGGLLILISFSLFLLLTIAFLLIKRLVSESFLPSLLLAFYTIFSLFFLFLIPAFKFIFTDFSYLGILFYVSIYFIAPLIFAFMLQEKERVLGSLFVVTGGIFTLIYFASLFAMRGDFWQFDWERYAQGISYVSLTFGIFYVLGALFLYRVGKKKEILFGTLVKLAIMYIVLAFFLFFGNKSLFLGLASRMFVLGLLLLVALVFWGIFVAGKKLVKKIKN